MIYQKAKNVAISNEIYKATLCTCLLCKGLRQKNKASAQWDRYCSAINGNIYISYNGYRAVCDAD